MSIYTPSGRDGSSRPGQRSTSGLNSNGGSGGAGSSSLSAEEEKDRALLAVLMGDQENQKLFQIMCNYLSLAQFELARSVLDQLFTLSPERVIRVLRMLMQTPRPLQW